MRVAFIGTHQLMAPDQIAAVREILDMLQPAEAAHASQCGSAANFDWLVWRYHRDCPRIIYPTHDFPMVPCAQIRPRNASTVPVESLARQYRAMSREYDAVLVACREMAADDEMREWWDEIRDISPPRRFLIDADGCIRVR